MKVFQSQHLKDLEEHLTLITQYAKDHNVSMVSRQMLLDIEELKKDMKLALWEVAEKSREGEKAKVIKWMEEMGYGPEGEEL